MMNSTETDRDDIYSQYQSIRTGRIAKKIRELGLVDPDLTPAQYQHILAVISGEDE